MKFTATALLMLAILAPSASAEDWPMFRYNETHTGWVEDNSEFGVFKDTNQTPLGRWWLQSLGRGIQVESSPVVVNGKLFIGANDGKLYAFDAVSGSPLWNYSVSKSRIQSTPATAQGRVFVVDEKGAMHAVNAEDGKLQWTYAVGETTSSPVVHNNKIFIGNDKGEVHSIDASTGNQYWVFKVTDYAMADGDDCDHVVPPAGTPAATCKDVAQEITSSPAVFNSRVYFGAWNNRFYSISEDPNSEGKSLAHWTYLANAPILGSPAMDLANDRIVFGTNNGEIFSLDAGTGAENWKLRDWDDEANQRPTQIESTPAVAYNKVIYGANNGQVIARDVHLGHVVWSFNTGGDVKSSPAVANNHVLVGNQDRKLFLLDQATGAKKWEYTAPDAFRASPAITGQLAFAAAFDGTIYAFGQDRPPRPDVQVESISAPSPQSGRAMQVKVMVKNVGNEPAPTNALKFFAGTTLVDEQDVLPLAAGGTDNLTITWTPSGTRAIELRAVADANNIILEFDEGNNVKTLSVRPGAAAPPATAPTSETGGGSPGFELTVFLLALAAIALVRRRA